MRQFLFSVFLLVITSATTLAQPEAFEFDRLGVAEGLPANGVVDIMRDSRGFMWLATDNGLVRYDGYDVRTFDPVDGDTMSISDRYVASLLEDEDGRIWVGTGAGGLNRFDPRTETFERFPIDPESDRGISNAFVNHLYRTEDGTIWIATDDGLDAFSGDTFTHYSYEEGGQGFLLDPIVTDILEDANGQLWIATNGGLHVLDRKTSGVKVYSSETHGLASDRINVLMAGKDGKIWIGSDGGLDLFDPSSETVTNFHHIEGDDSSLSASRVWSLARDNQGVLWVGTVGNDIADGLNRFNPGTGSFLRIRTDRDNVHGLSGNRIISLLADETGMLWVGTLNAGLNMLDLRGARFKHMFSNPLDPDGLTGNEILALEAADDGSLWAGAWSDGLMKINPKTGRVKAFDEESGISGNDILGLGLGADGEVWAGTFEGLNHYKPGSGRFTTYTNDPSDPNFLAVDAITDVLVDSRGTLWLSSWNGGVAVRRAGESGFELLQHDPDDASSIPFNRVLRVEEDQRGII